jgi:hypothetical protein
VRSGPGRRSQVPNPFLPLNPLGTSVSGENSRFQVKMAPCVDPSPPGPLPPVARTQSLQAKSEEVVPL